MVASRLSHRRCNPCEALPSSCKGGATVFFVHSYFSHFSFSRLLQEPIATLFFRGLLGVVARVHPLAMGMYYLLFMGILK